MNKRRDITSIATPVFLPGARQREDGGDLPDRHPRFRRATNVGRGEPFLELLLPALLGDLAGQLRLV